MFCNVFLRCWCDISQEVHCVKRSNGGSALAKVAEARWRVPNNSPKPKFEPGTSKQPLSYIRLTTPPVIIYLTSMYNVFVTPTTHDMKLFSLMLNIFFTSVYLWVDLWTINVTYLV